MHAHLKDKSCVIYMLGPMLAALSSTFITVNCRRRADTSIFSSFSTTQMYSCKWRKWVHNGKQNIKSRIKNIYKLQNKRLKTEDMTRCVTAARWERGKKKKRMAAVAATAACKYKKGRSSDKWMHYEYRACGVQNNDEVTQSKVKWSEVKLKRW